jgi:agmatine deiminase
MMLSRRQFTQASAVLTLPFAVGQSGCGLPDTNDVISQPLNKYEMPSESAPHDRTFMQWPNSLEVYSRRQLEQVQNAIITIAQAIAEVEPVVILAGGEQTTRARAALCKSVDVWDIPTEDLWCRDAGPTFVKNDKGELAIAHFGFNGWGNKQKHAADGQIAASIAEKLALPLLDTGLVGEQGGLEHDGNGLLLAHASSWVNPNRNSQNQDEIGIQLLTALGGQKIIWAPGIAGKDITDYHIDALARFVAPGHVLIQMPPILDRTDPWSAAAFETLAILKEATDMQGRKLKIDIVPEPVDIRSTREDFVASYVNYYVCNGAVICAQFGDRAGDGFAKEMLQSLYPGREIVALNVDALGTAGGGIHCATQQQPKVGVV